jgi:hypothetical protein
LREGPVREGRFTAVPITPIAPTLHGINPFPRNVPSVVFLSWLRSKARAGSPGDVLRKSVDIASQNKVSVRLFEIQISKPPATAGSKEAQMTQSQIFFL